MAITYYQFGFETSETRKTGIPARFATLTYAKWVKHLGEQAVKNILQGDHHYLSNGTVFYLHSSFTE